MALWRLLRAYNRDQEHARQNVFPLPQTYGVRSNTRPASVYSTSPGILGPFSWVGRSKINPRSGVVSFCSGTLPTKKNKVFGGPLTGDGFIRLTKEDCSPRTRREDIRFGMLKGIMIGKLL